MTKKNSRQHAIKNLKNARRSKKDEFYTQYIDIQKEIEKYLDYNQKFFFVIKNLIYIITK